VGISTDGILASGPFETSSFILCIPISQLNQALYEGASGTAIPQDGHNGSIHGGMCVQPGRLLSPPPYRGDRCEKAAPFVVARVHNLVEPLPQ
jgi:hypothetical protein